MSIQILPVMGETQLKKRSKLVSKLPFVDDYKSGSSISSYKVEKDDAMTYLVIEHRPSQTVTLSARGGQVCPPISSHVMSNGRTFQVYARSVMPAKFRVGVLESA